MFARFDRWLSVQGFLSKTALTLAGIGVLLTFISFVKGIQVLMFIPAFVLGLFVYSYFDVRRAKKSVVASWQNEQQLALRLLFTRPHRFCTFFLAFRGEDEIRLLQPQKNLTFVVPRTPGRFLLLIQGRLDIFRAVVELPEPPESATDSHSGESEIGEIYFSIKEYEEGDELKRIDPLQSAKRQKWYIRHLIHEPPIRRPSKHALPKILSLVSNQNLEPKTDVHSGRLIEWSMIALTVLAAHLEWRNLIFTALALGSMGFVYAWLQILKWKQPGRGWMNTVALLLFIGCFIEGGIIRDTVPAGTHFLILLAIWKHLFVRERRDAFTYVFLVLFVFVALSLYTLSAWFIILFFLFLIHSVSLLSIYSAGERAEEYQRAFESPPFRFDRLKISGIVLTLTLILFFVLPHGNQNKDTSLLETEQTNQTGFDEEVRLTDVLSIKQDFSKKIVIENARPEAVDDYARLYWRGMRFDRFAENTWKKPDFEPIPIRTEDVQVPETVSWDVRFYHQGGDTIFLPVAPIRIEDGRYAPEHWRARRMIYLTYDQDHTLYKFTDPQYNDALLRLIFAADENDMPKAAVDADFLYRPPLLDSETIALMTPFWESIPEEVQDDPQALSDYIMRDAGLRYSLGETAPNLRSFLYETKQGHCEYFASVLALTLQHLGYQATYVNGYQGGEWNERAKAWIIRGVNAHSWVEVFDNNGGWQRLDPTPPSDETFFPTRTQGWRLEFYQVYDWVELRWFEFFVSYTGEKQRELFMQLFVHRRLVFWSIVLWILYKKTYRPLRSWTKTTWNRTPTERFLWWLKRKSKGDVFVLHRLFDRFPELVDRTRKTVFGKTPHKSELKALKKAWKKSL